MQKKEKKQLIMVFGLILIASLMATLFVFLPLGMNSIQSDFKVSEYSTPLKDWVSNTHPKSSDDPISIVGDDWSIGYPAVEGTGTFEDPYVIADQIINANEGNGISIVNSQSYGRIENCTILNSTNGIYLGGVNNSKLIGNIVNNATFGIISSQSENCTLVENTVNDATYGIYLSYLSNFTLIENVVTDNSENGIDLESAPNCTLIGNSMTNNLANGIYFYNSENSTLVDNSAIENLEHGIHIYNSPYSNLTRNSATYNIFSGILLQDSENCTLIGNFGLNNIASGFKVFQSSNCTMIGNTAEDNTLHGIAHLYSSNTLLLENNITDNIMWGIHFFESQNCNVTDNIISYNDGGIFFDAASLNNIIYENLLIKNVIYDTEGHNDIHDNIIIDILTFSFTASDTNPFIDDLVNFIITSNGGYSPLSYSWDFGDGTISSDKNPSHSYSSEGNFTVTLTVTESDSDSSSNSLNIEVVSEGPPTNTTTLGVSGYPVGFLVFAVILGIIRIHRRKR